ncbi:MAG: phosphotransferase [Pseudonocardiaceae bacterium]
MPFRDIPKPCADLVHGDFNPGNILVAGDRITALIDAKAVGKAALDPNWSKQLILV